MKIIRALAVTAVILVLVVGGGAVWLYRDNLGGLLGLEREPVAVSPEAAASAEAKLRRLQDEGQSVRLSAIEVSSLIRYRTPGALARRVHEPSVEFAGDTLRLIGTVATSDLPPHPDLDPVRLLLPDSSRIQVSGRARPMGAGRIALEVHDVDFAGIPIPARYYPDILSRIGRQDEPGLAPNAFPVTLPEGIGSARLEGGYLLLAP